MAKCGVAQNGAAWLSRVRRGSVECGNAPLERRDSAGCGLAQQGAVWLSGERSGSLGAGGLLGQCSVRYRVRRSSVDSASGIAGGRILSQ
jgi:hypothetical protein